MRNSYALDVAHRRRHSVDVEMVMMHYNGSYFSCENWCGQYYWHWVIGRWANFQQGQGQYQIDQWIRKYSHSVDFVLDFDDFDFVCSHFAMYFVHCFPFHLNELLQRRRRHQTDLLPDYSHRLHNWHTVPLHPAVVFTWAYRLCTHRRSCGRFPYSLTKCAMYQSLNSKPEWMKGKECLNENVVWGCREWVLIVGKSFRTLLLTSTFERFEVPSSPPTTNRSPSWQTTPAFRRR